MELFCLGLSHHTAAVSLRERFAVGAAEVPAFLPALLEEAGLGEAAVLSTCNRVEVYGAAADGAIAGAACSSVLARRAGTEADFYRHTGDDAVRHLLRVAAGLDSMVPGETEILGQVKAAYADAVRAGTAGPLLHRVFQHALGAAKAVHANTALSRGAVSVGSAAVALAVGVLGDLSACRALVLGAGEAGSLVMRSLTARGIGEIIVANRSPDRAARLASELGGRTVPFEGWREQLAEVGIVVASATAPGRLLRAAEMEPVMRARERRPLFLLDLAVPRDFDPAIGEIPGVRLFDVDALQAFAREGLASRAREMGRAEDIVAGRAAAIASRLNGRMPLPAAA
jgi:glutamyl-tRNA reductase